MATIEHSKYAQFNDHELAAFNAKVWQNLPQATAEEVHDGRCELLHQVAMIADELPSARRHNLDTTQTPGWQGANAIGVVVMSAEDQARVSALVRAWRKAS